MNITEIIEALGGQVAVAYKMGVSQSTVYKWEHSGVPYWHWRKIIKLSKDKYTLEDLMAANETVVRQQAQQTTEAK